MAKQGSPGSRPGVHFHERAANGIGFIPFPASHGSLHESYRDAAPDAVNGAVLQFLIQYCTMRPDK